MQLPNSFAGKCPVLAEKLREKGKLEGAEIDMPDEWVSSKEYNGKTYWNITKPRGGDGERGNAAANSHENTSNSIISQQNTAAAEMAQLLKGMRELYRQLEELKQDVREIKDSVTVKF